MLGKFQLWEAFRSCAFSCFTREKTMTCTKNPSFVGSNGLRLPNKNTVFWGARVGGLKCISERSSTEKLENGLLHKWLANVSYQRSQRDVECICCIEADQKSCEAGVTYLCIGVIVCPDVATQAHAVSNLQGLGGCVFFTYIPKKIDGTWAMGFHVDDSWNHISFFEGGLWVFILRGSRVAWLANFYWVPQLQLVLEWRCFFGFPAGNYRKKTSVGMSACLKRCFSNEWNYCRWN